MENESVKVETIDSYLEYLPEPQVLIEELDPEDIDADINGDYSMPEPAVEIEEDQPEVRISSSESTNVKEEPDNSRNIRDNNPEIKQVKLLTSSSLWNEASNPEDENQSCKQFSKWAQSFQNIAEVVDITEHCTKIESRNKEIMIHSCKLCEETYETPRDLKIHKLVHTGKKPKRCDICGKCFIDISALKCHKRVHTGEKPYACDQCIKRFTNSSDLKKHKYVHAGIKPYPCTVCGKCFGSSSQLSKHKLIHTGERPYSCNICGKSFRASDALKGHKRIHTGDLALCMCRLWKLFQRTQCFQAT